MAILGSIGLKAVGWGECLLGVGEARLKLVLVARASILYAERNLRRSQFLDAEACEPLAHIHALLEGLALNNTGAEATGKGVTSITQVSVDIENELFGNSYPAPLVSLMSLEEISRTENSLTATSPSGLATAVTVGKVPCVTTAILGRAVFFLGS